MTLWLTFACADKPSVPADPGSVVGVGLFSEGCAEPGTSLAREIGVSERLPGAVAVGSKFDFLLANDVAAYVVTRPEAGSTYFHYGGIIADAVAMADCEAQHDDVLDEVGLVLGTIDLLDFDASILHAFRANEVAVLADGSDGGPAIVRATGTDDMYWLVEYELIRSAVHSGGRPLSSPWGLEVTVDYILDPGSSVLRIEWDLGNPSATESYSLMTGALMSLAPSLDSYGVGTSSVSFGGVTLGAGIPYLVASDGEGAFAFGVEAGNLGTTEISGILVALDLDQVIQDSIQLPPGGTGTSSMLVSVGAGGGGAASGPLIDESPQRVPNSTAIARTITGFVRDTAGQPVSEGHVVVWADGGAGSVPFDADWSGANGSFSVVIPDFDSDPWIFDLWVSAPGRGLVGPLSLQGTTSVDAVVGDAGGVALSVSEGGQPVPARVVFVRDDGLRSDIWTVGTEAVPLAPGSWSYTVTRGFEYEPVVGNVEVSPGDPINVSVAIVRVVDTSGWMSIDTHVHDSNSPDSRVLPEDQVRHAAAHGLDIVLHTNHEHIVEERQIPFESGLSAFVASMVGEEVTASVPEHMTMMAVAPDGTGRGGPVPWYQMGLTELFSAMRERSSGGLNFFNHPGYMDLVDWDPVTATPGITDPVLLGLAPGTAIWSWDFDGIEVMNGFQSPFAQGNGRFEKWQSALNAGHRIFPLGCSDDHGGDEVGFPRTYFPYLAESPADLDEAEVLATLATGAVVVSGGAFARVEMAGAGPGEVVSASGSVDLSIAVTAPSAIDVTHVVVFANCDEVARIETTEPHGIVKLETILPLTFSSDTHVTIAAFGADFLPLGLPQFSSTAVPRVLTQAIFLDVDGNGVFDAPGGRVCAYDVN